MKIAVLGTGQVGRTLAAKLDELGHEVTVGTRDPGAKLSDAKGDPSFPAWHDEHPDVALETFADAERGAELIVNATNGAASLEALEAAGEDNLEQKVLLDVANPLDSSGGMPPTLAVSNDDSLAERIQRRFAKAKVVKGLNTVTADLMVDPGQLAKGDHTLFIAGDNSAAKEAVVTLVNSFGWSHVIDIGDITNARGLEMYLPLWVRLYAALGTPVFNVKVTTD